MTCGSAWLSCCAFVQGYCVVLKALTAPTLALPLFGDLSTVVLRHIDAPVIAAVRLVSAPTFGARVTPTGHLTLGVASASVASFRHKWVELFDTVTGQALSVCVSYDDGSGLPSNPLTVRARVVATVLTLPNITSPSLGFLRCRTRCSRSLGWR